MRRPKTEPLRLPVLLAVMLVSGFVIPAVTPALAHQGHGDEGELMVVAAVSPDGPAAVAGLEEGDRVLQFDGQEIRTQQELGAFLSARQPGETVKLLVERDGETHELPLVLGEHPQGGVLLGISLGVEVAGQGSPAAAEGLGRAECVAWVDDTYRPEEVAKELGVDVSDFIPEIRACMDRDTKMMSVPIPVPWCDNIFKVHCSGLDLLAEIGDALVNRCEELLSDSLGVDIRRETEWATCGEQEVFDAYSMRGVVTDAAACRRVLVEECGAGIDEPESGGP